LRIAEWATRQFDVIARWQLVVLGLSEDAIDKRVWRGRLHVIHEGVYAVGHRMIGRSGRLMAAVLASLIAEATDAPDTRGEFEDRFTDFLREHPDIPTPHRKLGAPRGGFPAGPKARAVRAARPEPSAKARA